MPGRTRGPGEPSVETTRLTFPLVQRDSLGFYRGLTRTEGRPSGRGSGTKRGKGGSGGRVQDDRGGTYHLGVGEDMFYQFATEYVNK